MSGRTWGVSVARWRTVPLAEVLDWKEGPGILAKDFRDLGVPLIRLAGVKRGANILAGCNHLDREMVDRKWSHFRLALGDVLLSTSASLGEVAVVGPEGVGAIPYTGLIRFRPVDNQVSPRYVPIALTAGSFKRQIEAMGAGSVIRHFGPMHLRQMTVDLPPTAVQESIADLIEALDAKIESNGRLVAYSHELLDAMAAARCASLPPTPLGSLSGLTRGTVSPDAVGVAVVDHYSLPAFDASGRPERVPPSTIMSNKIALRGSAVLVSRLNPRTNRTWWAVPAGATIALASTEFAVLSASTEVELAAIWLAVRHPSFLEELPRRVTGTSGSHQRVRPDDLLAIDVPDVRRLDDATKKTALDLLRLAHQRREESARLSGLRAALLPELLSGRIRVPEAEAVIQDVANESESA